MDIMKIRRLLDEGKSIYELPLRVVFYARVSTDRDEQLNSLENQTSYYEGTIKNNPKWEYCGGYIDEGISGTSVNKRENFLKMIDDGTKERFDLIITKEISRFSRSTLDSIKYTQLLLEHGVGVFFQSDNINTLYSDSELRLTIMASLAQDEMRRLSERVRFGMRQAYENGKVLGTNNLYGYKKSGCRLVIDEEGAKFIKDIFDLYATGSYGFRTIARILTERGYRNKKNGEINPGTLRQIITNPKYKGYYHGRLTQSNNYRDKKSVKLPKEEHLLYKDDDIPAIVSEDIWERANAVLREREKKYSKKSGGMQNRFAYSGKIVCEKHGTFYYRKMWKDRKIPQEGWCCKVYLAKGRQGCNSPNLYTRDINAILTQIGRKLLSEKEIKADADELLAIYSSATAENADNAGKLKRIEAEIRKINSKKDKLFELYTDGDIDKAEFTEMKDRLSIRSEKLYAQAKQLENESAAVRNKAKLLAVISEEIQSAGKEEAAALAVAQSMLDQMIVLDKSTEKCVRLDIKMKFPKVTRAVIVKPFILYGETEVSPIVGTEKQSEELVHYLLDEFKNDPAKIWESNIFGKSLYELVNEGVNNKLAKMPDEARQKLATTLERIINEGSGGLICIIL